MASSSHSNQRFEYDVFLSFRGEDTRYCFTCFLFDNLRGKSIRTFKDDDELEKGEEIAPALLTAIEESRAAIIVFSKNYATSSWCLDELAKIMECHENHGQMVFPVFYDVDPSHVRNHLGSFGNALAAHEKDPKKSVKVQKWKAALSKAANIAGHSTKEIRDGAKLVNDIVGDILKKLMPIKLSQSVEGLVGIDSRIEEVKRLLFSGSLDVCVLGIWGMAGIGKTTIARAVFEQIACQFEGFCFLNNVREESEKSGGLDSLVKKTLSRLLGKWQPNWGTSEVKNMLHGKRVLIVLDDVSDLRQIEPLAARRSWFGAGSKILLTSRDKQVLEYFVDHTYEVEELNYADALQLFSRKAFKLEEPPEDWMYLCNSVLQYGKGNPLALQVLGSFLFRGTKSDWESALNRLKKGPLKDIQKVLKISYDGLEEEEKKIFLHIACFFKGEHQDHVIQILDGCDLSTKIGIRTLIGKALINISNDHLVMHDLLQEMGRAIVLEESEDPGKRSRLWSHEDICAVFNKNSGTEAIEGIFLDMSKLTTDLCLNRKAFSKMPNLKLLKFYIPYEGIRVKGKVHLSQGLESLPTNLRYLHWYGYPLPSLPANFDPVNLVELHLQNSSIKQLWEGTKDLNRLKKIKLNYSKLLIKPSDLSRAPDLRTITCRGCHKLKQFPLTTVRELPSCLRSITSLILSRCKNIRSFQDHVDLPSLEVLDLSDCSALEKFPPVSGNIKRLNLSGTAIRELPSSIKFLTSLAYLDLVGCKNIRSFPDGVDLPSLEVLDLSHCSALEKFPPVSGNLKRLNLSGTAIRELPSSIKFLTSLAVLDLARCENIRCFPHDVDLPSLESLYLSGCSKLEQFPLISQHVEYLLLDGTAISEVPSSVERLCRLVRLQMSQCNRLKSLPRSICKLKSLVELFLDGCSNFDDFPDISETMDNLFALKLNQTAIVNLPESLGNCESLTNLYIGNCSKLEKLPENIESLKELDFLEATGCNNLSTLPNGLIHLPSIYSLYLTGCNFERLPTDINRLSKLDILDVSDCKRLQSLPELPLSLTAIHASDCASLETVPAINPMSKLRQRGFANCFKLDLSSWGDNMEDKKRIRKRFPPQFLIAGEFYFFYPGSGIPRWFKYQSPGSSINIQLQQHWNVLGFALCTVFQPKWSELWNYSNRVIMQCTVHFGINDGKNENHDRADEYCEFWGFGRPEPGAEHLAIWHRHFFHKAEYLHCMKSCCSEFSFEFTLKMFNPGRGYEEAAENLAEVIKCGVCPIYDHDEEEANPEITAEEDANV